jgi:peptide/nickel transport system ATP-binding protein
VPRLTQPIAGCAFAERCAFVVDKCRIAPPPLGECGPGHLSACWRSADLPVPPR